MSITPEPSEHFDAQLETLRRLAQEEGAQPLTPEARARLARIDIYLRHIERGIEEFEKRRQKSSKVNKFDWDEWQTQADVLYHSTFPESSLKGGS
jgi:hypothetical protein